MGGGKGRKERKETVQVFERAQVAGNVFEGKGAGGE